MKYRFSMLSILYPLPQEATVKSGQNVVKSLVRLHLSLDVVKSILICPLGS